MGSTSISYFTKVPKGFLLIIFLMLTVSARIFAQEPPPRPIQVTPSQNIGFGAFTMGASGGSVIITPAGSRSATGDVILLSLGYTFSAAAYRVVGNPGTVVSLLNGADVSLTGSNGGSMLLHIGSSSPASPLVINTTPPAYTELFVGGTLTVGNAAANPPGAYNGTFFITFIQE
jgi:hypothetical protein